MPIEASRILEVLARQSKYLLDAVILQLTVLISARTHKALKEHKVVDALFARLQSSQDAYIEESHLNALCTFAQHGKLFLNLQALLIIGRLLRWTAARSCRDKAS